MWDYLNKSVLVVDDIEANIDILVETLADDYKVRVAMDGETALEDAIQAPPDLILLDIVMPDMDGYEVCRRLKAAKETQDIPVIFLTSLSEEGDEANGLALGAVDYITKPFNSELIKSRVHNHMELKLHRDHLEELVRERTRSLLLTQEATIESLVTLTEFRHPETGGHIKRTQNYIRCMAEYLCTQPRYRTILDDETIELMYRSAPLHDIGKVCVPDHILLKPGMLAAEEFDEIKKHPVYGRDAIMISERKLGKDSFMRHAKEIAYAHHEKWDGTGYPQGLKGEEIPLSGRIMAIADVYDALVSRRVYKPPFPHSKAISIIVEGRGTHFDPELIDAFEALAEDLRSIALEFSDHEEERKALCN
jgi:cyclic di-GMP phosphodiesterase